FSYPTAISGDQVWIAGFDQIMPGVQVDYGWWQTSFFNTIFGWFDWALFDPGASIVDGFTGATPLALAYEGGWSEVTQHYSNSVIMWNSIIGSIRLLLLYLISLVVLLLLVSNMCNWLIMFCGWASAVLMRILFKIWSSWLFMHVHF